MKRHLRQKQTFISLILWAIFSFIVVIGISGLSSVFSAHAIESPSIQGTQAASAQSLLHDGIEHFQAERYQEAIANWQQALNAYELVADEQRQALVLSNLSLAHQHLGQWDNAETSLAKSLTFFNQQTADSRSRVSWDYYAKALNAQGWLHFRQGRLESALESWQGAMLAYNSANNLSGIIGSQINQAKALQLLGLSIAAKDMLAHAYQIIQEEGNSDIKAIALQSLGNALRRVGELEESQQVLEESLTIAMPFSATALPSTQYNSTQHAILLDLGNTERALWERATALSLDEVDTHYTNALNYYQLVADDNPEQSSLLRTKAIANTLSLLIDAQRLDSSSMPLETAKWQKMMGLWDDLRSAFMTIPLGRSGIEVQLNSVNSILNLLPSQRQYWSNQRPEIWSDVSQVLVQSVQQARELSDRRTEAMALGQLGNLYVQVTQWRDAKVVTEEAITLSEAIRASDIQYRWEWQLARILAQQGNSEAALKTFEQSVSTLDKVRQDLLFIDSEVQFSFRDDIEPLYRQYVDLLLSEPEVGEENLKKATELIDSLQLAELENYLGCNIDPVQISEKVIDPTAAVIYPIILTDSLLENQSERLEVVLQMPDQSFQRSSTAIFRGEFDNLTTRLYNELPVPSRWRSAQHDAGQLYDLLIQPFETVLDANQTSFDEQPIETLVFVLDGALRNIPMAVLWDGDRQEYLLEKYAIATAPSLQVVEPQPLSRPIKILAAGSSEALEHPFRDSKFSPLLNVAVELEAIKALESQEQSQISTDILFNDTFTRADLERRLQREDYSIVHLASHGVFSSDPERTFIALPDPERVDSFPEKVADKENYAIFSNELDTLLRTRNQENNAIELLVLSACQTATGDNRAALGLAGLTVRAGARSTLATLWSVDDESAANVMEHFYRQLIENPNISRSEALRQAQINLWDMDESQMRSWKRPYFWAPYILAGNWL